MPATEGVGPHGRRAAVEWSGRFAMDGRATRSGAEAPVAAAAPDRLLGREAELERLVAALAGDGWVAVVGEAGIGKTRLIRAAIAASGRTAREGGAFATLSWLPYLALRRAVGRELAGDAVQAATVVEAVVGPDVLVLDDLQWADPSTLAALEILAGRVQVVAAVRQGDPGEGPARAALGRGDAEVVELSGLADETAAALVRRVRADLGREATSRMVRQAGGNPLLLEEMARSGESVGVFGRALDARRARLSPEARGSLDLLAVADQPLRAIDLAAVDELVGSGLVRRRGDDVEMRHALLADGIRDGLDAGELEGLHVTLADRVIDPAERARHLLAAGRRDAAAAVVRAALPRIEDQRAFAVLWVALADATGTAEDRIRAATELVPISDFATILRLTEGPIDLTTQLGLEAAYQRANALSRLGRSEESSVLVDAALAANPDRTSSPAVRLLMQAAILLVNHHGDPAAALAFAEDQIERAEPGPLLAPLIHFREAVKPFVGKIPDLEVMTTAVYEGFDDPRADVYGRAKNTMIILRVLQGALPSFEFGFKVARQLEARGFDSPALDLFAEVAGSAVYAGRFEEAVAICDDILDRPGSARSRGIALEARTDALTYLGRFDLAGANLRDAAALPLDRSEASNILMARLELEYWSGAAARATATADELLAHGSSSDVNVILPLVTAAWADLDLGRPVRAVPDAGLPALAGIVHEVAGITALAEGRPEDAASAFDEAVPLLGPFFATNTLHARWASADARRRAGIADAAELLRDVEADALAIGFAPLVAIVRRSLRLAGVRVSAEREGPRRIGLSARETQVVGLVEQGLSNLEIARRLGLGRPTVSRMVSSAMGKLGVSRRTELAARELV